MTRVKNVGLKCNWKFYSYLGNTTPLQTKCLILPRTKAEIVGLISQYKDDSKLTSRSCFANNVI